MGMGFLSIHLPACQIHWPTPAGFMPLAFVPTAAVETISKSLIHWPLAGFAPLAFAPPAGVETIPKIFFFLSIRRYRFALPRVFGLCG